jgi:oligoendopeptidase F
MVTIRDQVARNAGFDDYRAFKFVQLHRDYAPEDCERFHAAVEQVVLPASRELDGVRRRALGVDVLHPWDLGVDLFGRGQDRLFDDEAELVELGMRTFRAIDPGFADEFDILVRNGLLDLMSRPGKAPGGYQSTVGDIRLPFIFMNGVGTPRNYETLLHEGGHAFHALACREIPVPDYWKAPTEFCEVAAMSMELFAFDHLAKIVGEERARAIRYAKLERLVGGFADVALIDAFQHWVYTHPECAPVERRAKWAELADRFGRTLDWGPLADLRSLRWHRIPHPFNHAFYYIEYGIAQLGALQLWQLERRDHGRALAAYRRALALGGTRPLPELFEAAGIRFAMDEAIFRDLIAPVMDELGELSPGA